VDDLQVCLQREHDHEHKLGGGTLWSADDKPAGRGSHFWISSGGGARPGGSKGVGRCVLSSGGGWTKVHGPGCRGVVEKKKAEMHGPARGGVGGGGSRFIQMQSGIRWAAVLAASALCFQLAYRRSVSRCEYLVEYERFALFPHMPLAAPAVPTCISAIRPFGAAALASRSGAGSSGADGSGASGVECWEGGGRYRQVAMAALLCRHQHCSDVHTRQQRSCP